MIKNFNEKARYPFTYDYKNADEVMLSNSAVELMFTLNETLKKLIKRRLKPFLKIPTQT